MKTLSTSELPVRIYNSLFDALTLTKNETRIGYPESYLDFRKGCGLDRVLTREEADGFSLDVILRLEDYALLKLPNLGRKSLNLLRRGWV